LYAIPRDFRRFFEPVKIPLKLHHIGPYETPPTEASGVCVAKPTRNGQNEDEPTISVVDRGRYQILVTTNIWGLLPTNHQTHQLWESLYPFVPFQSRQHTYSLSTANRLQPTKRSAWWPVFRPFAWSRLTPKHLWVESLGSSS
jgi:hypothetical protein